MKAIVLVDTSIFCEVLDVPKLATKTEAVRTELRDRIEHGQWLLLPLATIIETGNHIAQNGDGRQRRASAQRFVRQVEQALAGNSPFRPTSPILLEDLQRWLADFPEHAARGLGVADLSIIKEWERQCTLHPARRVSIWSLDADLAGYDRGSAI